jgi:hypothetical protein
MMDRLPEDEDKDEEDSSLAEGEYYETFEYRKPGS